MVRKDDCIFLPAPDKLLARQYTLATSFYIVASPLQGGGKLNRAACSSILWELGQRKETFARQIKGTDFQSLTCCAYCRVSHLSAIVCSGFGSW